jgi:hypothetical protein
MSPKPNPEICTDAQRRVDSRAHLNGIDSIDVSSDKRTLTVTFFGDAPAGLHAGNVRIEGGVRITDLRIVEVRLCSADNPDVTNCALVNLDKPGDASIYALSVTGLHGFDPRYSRLEFSFRPDCPGDLDCAASTGDVPQPGIDPELNYLGRDYQGFRQLMLDRLSVTVPDWKERHIPDLGIALVEVLAYVGDRLSYYQDAVATEAYLGTARKRISVRRHARLMDYALNEGCNARVFVAVKASQDTPEIDAQDIDFITTCSAVPPGTRGVVAAAALADVPAEQYEVFRPVKPGKLVFREAHYTIPFYTWGDGECYLPKGAVRATLRDDWEKPASSSSSSSGHYEGRHEGRYQAEQETRHEGKYEDQYESSYESKEAAPEPDPPRKLRNLKVGDILILEEIRGPKTGAEADADPSHRQAVLLTSVTFTTDPLYPLGKTRKQPVVEIEWAEEDALPFALWLTAVTPPDCAMQEISVARGNVVLADHGRLVEKEGLGSVPATEIVMPCEEAGEPPERVFTAGSFEPSLAGTPLTFREAPGPAVSAAAMLRQAPNLADPQIWLMEDSTSWQARRDLLGSAATERVYCVEVDDDGVAHLRFGDNNTGLAPAAGGVNANERTKKTYPDSDKTAVSAGGALQLVVGENLIPIQLGPAENNLEGLRRAIEGAGAGVTASIWKLRGHTDAYVMYVAAEEVGQMLLQLVDHPDHAGENLLTKTHQGVNPPVFRATYRVGNGVAGNVGSEAISGIVARGGFSGVSLEPRNPLAASGGAAAEPIPEAKLRIPTAFRKELQRAITADDYARLAERNPKVQAAAATLRWTGNRYAVRVAIDPLGSAAASQSLVREVADSLYRYRRIGHEVQVVPAAYAAIYLALQVCVDPDYSGGQVHAALLDAFSNQVGPSGARGFFHPDNLSFGGSIYLSAIVARAAAIAGVQTVKVSALERLFEGPAGEVENGVLVIGPLEVARLDNDSSRPENGVIRLDLEGGR